MSAPHKLLGKINGVLKDREAKSARRRLTIAAPDAVDFSSNDFLSLAKSGDLRETYLNELANAKSVPLASGSSRLLDGNSSYIEEIETELTTFYNAPSGLIFNSGFDANSGFFSCVPQHNDVVVYDEYIHASVHDGMRLSRASRLIAFRHNCLQDLEETLRTLVESDSAVSLGDKHVFIAVESVYSMDGDIAPIKDILDFVEALLPQGNGHVIVDEAHATGIYGPMGRGLVCELGVEDRILARLHTFGKALSSCGAILLCNPLLRDYLINYAKSFIYTTAMGLPTLAMIKTVHTFMKEGRTQSAQQQLWRLIYHFNDKLQALPSTPLLQITSEAPKSPIFSVCTQDPRSLASKCQENGVVVRAIMPPTVPKGGQRVRICLHTNNTFEEIDRFMTILSSWIKEESSKAQQLPQAIERSRL